MALIRLSVQDKRMLAEWIGLDNMKMSLIYSADRDGCSWTAFHKKCNYRSPVLVVASTTDGYIFGGYAPVPWVATHGTFLPAPEAFLFRLRKSNSPDYVKFAALDGKTAIQSVSNWGPYFGNMSGNNALRFFGSVVQKQNDMFTCSELSVNFANGFKNNGLDNNALHGGNKQLINIEVYTVEEDLMLEERGLLLEERWRRLDFTEAILANLKEEIVRFEPPKQLAIPKANILLVGQVGAGKSSFFNTLSSAFQGYVTVKATTGSGATRSITTKFRQYGLRSGRGGQELKLRLCDTMGLEDNGGLVISDVPYILDGNIQTGFQFNPTAPVSARHPDFQALAKPKDCMHVLAIVIDCSAIPSMSSSLCEKFRTIIQHANERSIPVAVLLCKVDEACEETARDLSNVFLSKRIEETVNVVAEKLGIVRSCILPVKNYEREVDVVTAVDVLALHTLVRLVRMATDALDDLMELRGYHDYIDAPGPVGAAANADRAGAGDRK